MSNYEVAASPFFHHVTCPKHKNLMEELKNGFLGEKLWWCYDCERVYELKPSLMPMRQIDEESLKKQIQELNK